VGLQRHDLGNNESVSTGYEKTDQGYLALTRTESKWFKTERGAITWLDRRGYNPDGTRKDN
jgi:hypothetical protein